MNNKIKGYKASYNGVCKGHKYEVGKTYTISDIEMNARGFHFCVDMKDVVNFYIYDKKFVLFEVIGSGELITKGYTTVCSQIEIVRIVPENEYSFPFLLYEYDENGNLIHHKNSNGNEYWKTYGKNKKLIHYKNSTGFEQWNTYDDNNEIIYYKDKNGYECWQTFDNNRNLIHYKDSTGYEFWRTFDNNRNLIHYKTSTGFEQSY